MPTYKYVVDLSWSGMGSPGVNVWHFRTTTDSPDNAEVPELVDAIKDFYTGCLGLYSNDAVIQGPSTLILDPYGTPEYRPATSWTLQGQGGGSKAPAATAVTVTWRTTSATRSGRGRTFLSPITTSAMDGDGTINTTQLTALRGAAAALVAFNEGFDNGAVGVYSPSQNLLRDIVAYNVRDTFAVLRSRRD